MSNTPTPESSNTTKKVLTEQERNDPEKNKARVRNIGFIAHVDGGKTTMTEAVLYNSGVKHKRGSVDDGTTTTDSDPNEATRGITISAACVTIPWSVDSDKLPHLKDQ
jgi:translation elongation factor EF-G